MENKFIYESVNIFTMESKPEITTLLAAEMKKRHLSLREVAKLVGVSHPLIGNILDGETPSFETCLKLASFLHISDVRALRAAGLVKPNPGPSEQQEELLYLFDQLPDQEKRSLIRFIRATLDAIEKD